MKNTTYGYVRVSTKDQNEARQMIAMHEFGIDKKHIFLDKLSGKDFNRPQYHRLMRKLKKDDTLVIKSIDRLGRNYNEIIDQMKSLINGESSQKKSRLLSSFWICLCWTRGRDGI